MKDKIIRAYETAWKWPEVYSEAPVVIWTSRVIAFAVPLSLIVLLFLTGVPLFGWAATGVIAVFVGLGLILATVSAFSPEYHTVEDFQMRESRIKDYFHGFPAHTCVPVIESEEGVWVSYGHVEPDVFLQAIQKVVLHVTEDQERADNYLTFEDSVGHLYAQFRNPEEDHWSEGIVMCKPTATDCFPITRIEIQE